MGHEGQTIELIERSCADMLLAVAADPTLTSVLKRHWSCSIRVICEMLGPPPQLWAARWTALRVPTSQLHHLQRADMTPKTLRNHLANFRRVLAWYAREEGIPRRAGVCLSPECQQLRDSIRALRDRAQLSGLMRFCSAKGREFTAVDEEFVDAYMSYRAATTKQKSDNVARRRIARAWNRCVGSVPGWPKHRLCEPPVKPSAGPALHEFPGGLRIGIDAYLTRLTKARKAHNGRRLKACNSRTIDVRRAMLLALVRRAVGLGTPINSLASLSDLLSPELVQRCLDSYWPENSPKPSIYCIDLAGLLVSVARTTDCVSSEGLGELCEMRSVLEEDRTVGLTDKNWKLVRQVLSPGVWKSVAALPGDLMQRARATRDHSPVKAAVLAQMAVAIGILLVAPIRLSNLATIQLDINLLQPGGPQAPYWLTFPDYDVKNRVRLNFKLDPRVGELIHEYVHNDLHVLRRGSNELFLFPGEQGGHKGKATLSTQISQWVLRATGLRLTVHQFRHAAAALLLHAQPGNFEFVRQALGHKSIKTTTNFYTATQSLQATRTLSDLVYGELDFDSAPM